MLFRSSPAERAGLRPGDGVVTAGGQPVDKPSQLVAAVERAGVGKPLVLTVSRSGRQEQLTVVPADMAAGSGSGAR